MEEIFRIATQISTPLALAGFLAASLFIIIRLVLTKNLKGRVRPAESGLIVRQIIDRFFVLSLAAMVFGFAGWTLIAIQKTHAAMNSDRPPRSNPVTSFHDTDESGIRYHVTWSVDPNCSGWQNQLSAHPELATSHSCEFKRTGRKIGESRDPFDHWNIAVAVPGDVYDVDCQKNAYELFEDGTNGEGNHHKGVAEGRWGRCTGYINGGDDPVTVTAYYRVFR